MELEVSSSISVVELDQLIRRALQNHYLVVTPPAVVWDQIQRYLDKRKRRIPGHHTYTTTPIIHTDIKGRKDGG